MGLLDKIMAQDAGFAHDINEFAESVTYTPIGASAVTVPAVVDRLGVVPYPDQPDRVSEVFRVSIPYAEATSTAGLSAAQAGDTISLPRKTGLPASSVSVMSVQETDAGAWVLECR